MAAKGGRPSSPLVERLIREPHRFEFFQAVRLLERVSRGDRDDSADHRGVGSLRDASHHHESIRFSSPVSLGFPGAPIASVQQDGDNVDEPLQFRMEASFMGLIGAAGILPHHYSQLVLDRVRRNDLSLRDFLDLLNHRSLRLFYRAWKKHRILVAYEEAQTSPLPATEDLFTQCLYALVGMGSSALQHAQRTSSALRDRLSFHDDVLLYFSGHLSHRPRSASGLIRILTEFLDVPVQVRQFQGRWLRLQPGDCSRLSNNPAYNRLGDNVLVGSRVWSGESSFRVSLGPLRLETFLQFTPRGKRLQELSELVRLYVGIEYDFRIQPVLMAAEIPDCRLSVQTYLGWNSWLISRPRERNGDEAVFAPRGIMEPTVAG